MYQLQAVTDNLTRTPPSAGIVLGAAALAGTLLGVLWFAVVHALTVAHEGGHALLAVVMGGRIGGVRIDLRKRGGETQWGAAGSVGWLAELPVVLAGYSAPPLFGLLGAFLLANGWAVSVLWASAVLLALLLTTARNIFGFLYIALIGLGFYLAARRASPEAQVVIATTWIWFLLFGGLLRILQRGRRAADFARLREMTFIPAVIWLFVFVLLALGAIIAAVVLLLGGLGAPSG